MQETRVEGWCPTRNTLGSLCRWTQPPRSKCWQREIREKESARQLRLQDDSLRYSVEAIPAAEARPFILRYEWLGTMGRSAAIYGARDSGGELAAVACFGWPASPQSRDICGQGYRDQAVCLERGACSSWAHPHAGSWFISRAVREASRDHGWVIFYAYSDEEAGEIGTIYQACNWIYLGQGVGRSPGRKPEDFRRPDGSVVSSRTLRHHGLKKQEALDLGWQVVEREPKHKYVHFEGCRRTKRELLSALRYPPQAYPKRDR